MSRLILPVSALVLLTVAPASAEVIPIAQTMRGAAVTVTGTVDRISDDDDFLLTDATGTLRVYIGANRMPVTVGEKVSVSGVMDDDLGPRELYAQSIIRADGQVIELANSDE